MFAVAVAVAVRPLDQTLGSLLQYRSDHKQQNVTSGFIGNDCPNVCYMLQENYMGPDL